MLNHKKLYRVLFDMQINDSIIKLNFYKSNKFNYFIIIERQQLQVLTLKVEKGNLNS